MARSVDSPTILLLEDDPEQREIFCEILGGLGCVVLCASEIRQALRILQEHHSIIQHVFSDNQVGLLEAGSAMKEASALFGIPCLVFSGVKTDGVDLEKPFDWGYLWDYLRGASVASTG